MSELTFDPERHLYRLDGAVLPSVTQLMKPLSAAKYDGIDESIMDKAAKRGTAVHEAIEFYNACGVMEIAPEFSGYTDAYLQWFDRFKPNIFGSEIMTYHKILHYAGTVDVLAEFCGKTWLIDLKTTAVINDMLTSVQLEAYAQALGTHGIEVDHKAILHLRRDGEWKFKTYRKRDTEAWKVFTALVTVQAYIAKYEGGTP